jgi:hypothetical protein
MAAPLPQFPTGNQGRDPDRHPPGIVVLIESMAEEGVVLLAEDLLGILMRRAGGQGSEVPFRPP